MRTEQRRDYLTGRDVRVYVWKQAIPNVAHGVVVSLGDLKQLAHAAGLDAASVEGWQMTGWNVPAHWTNPELREFITEEVPEVLEAQ
jgi:hypothetical protein